MPRHRRFGRGPRTPKVPKFKVAKQTWKPKQLTAIYKKVVAGSVAARIAALYEALNWFDGVIPQLVATKALTPDEDRKFALAIQLRGQASGTPENAGYDGEKETCLRQCIKRYEAIWSQDGKKFPLLQPFYDQYEKVKDKLEAKDNRANDKFTDFSGLMNRAFGKFGMKFGVHEHSDNRQFDGEGTILYNVDTAKQLQNEVRHMGLLPVIFKEAVTVLNAKSFIKVGNDPVFSLERKSDLVPDLLSSILDFIQTVPKSKVIKSTQPPVPKPPKAPKVAGSGAPRPTGPRGGGNPNNLPFMPSSVIGTVFEMCLKGTTLGDIKKVCTDRAANIDRVLKTMPQEEYRGLKWKFTRSGDNFKIQYPLP